jgi:hypothetical protein
MDHLDLASDRGHQINYSLPRICHVRNVDFNFVMAVDKNKLSLGNSFGRLPICATLHPSLPCSCFFFFALLLPFFLLFKGTYIFTFVMQFHDFSFTRYAPAPAPAPRSADPAHAHGLEASEEVPIVSSLHEWLKRPAQIDIQEVHQSPSFLHVANTIIYAIAHTPFLETFSLLCDFITVIFRTRFLGYAKHM